MDTNSYYHSPAASPSLPSNLEKFLAVVLGGFGLATAFLALFSMALTMLFAGRMFPGLNVAGVEIGGMSREAASAALQAGISYPTTGLVVVESDGQVWTFTPGQLGLTVDHEATLDHAYAQGREGWPWQRIGERIRLLRSGKVIAPVMLMDERLTRQTLGNVAAEINQEMREASLQLEGTRVIAIPGQVGRIVDLEAALAELKPSLLSLFNANITLQVTEYQPTILDASAQAELATALLSQPLVLRASPDPNEKFGPWELSPETLVEMLVIERTASENGATYVVKLNENRLHNLLAPLAPGLTHSPQNARFIFNDETRLLEVIQQAVNGRELLVSESVANINARLAEGQHTIDLTFQEVLPDVTDSATGEQLGITELVAEQSTFFYGSDDGRIQNIVTAAGQFHGLLVPPGATFSMVDNIGDISLDSGYAEAWIIYGDRTVKGVGGGVCQVSTTLFRTVFFGGFPVVERWPHSYRVYYYELAQSGAVNENMAGLDATVYAPVVDFRFTNDTPYWLLMETYVDVAARRLTWKFYSTSDGRQVDWSTTGLQDRIKPPYPVYEESDDLNKGQIKQVDWAVEGASVTVSRTVTRGGSVLFEDTFATTYVPWASVCQYGPGTKDYPPEGDDRDRYKCQKQ
jgi:vancomycin resistance protein YoaR